MARGTAAMRMVYRHRQTSTPIKVSFAILAVLLLVILLLVPHAWPGLLAAFVAAAAVHYLFSSLTIDVSDQEIAWHFGPGVWRKRLALSDIESTHPAHVPWWYGIGVKWTPRGWVYVVSWGDALELRLKNGKAIRIGTDDLRGLAAALANR